MPSLTTADFVALTALLLDASVVGHGLVRDLANINTAHAVVSDIARQLRLFTAALESFQDVCVTRVVPYMQGQPDAFNESGVRFFAKLPSLVQRAKSNMLALQKNLDWLPHRITREDLENAATSGVQSGEAVYNDIIVLCDDEVEATGPDPEHNNQSLWEKLKLNFTISFVIRDMRRLTHNLEMYQRHIPYALSLYISCCESYTLSRYEIDCQN